MYKNAIQCRFEYIPEEVDDMTIREKTISEPIAIGDIFEGTSLFHQVIDIRLEPPNAVIVLAEGGQSAQEAKLLAKQQTDHS